METKRDNIALNAKASASSEETELGNTADKVFDGNKGKLDESYEGVLRQLLADSPERTVVELFFMHKDNTSAQPEQEALRRHYGLPMIGFRDTVWPELQAA